MKIYLRYLFISFLTFSLASCSNNKKEEKKEDILVGNLPIIVDETVLPLFLEQSEVFESSYPDAKLKAIALPEIEAINGLIKGDANIAFLNRELTELESKSFDQRSVKPRIYQVAYDGIILVGNSSTSDSTITESDIVSLLKGQKIRELSLIFEDLNSSTLGYFIRRGAIEKVSSSHVETKESAEAILDYVANTPNKIGVLSYNQYLTLQRSFSEMDKIRILSVLNDKLVNKKYVKPSQASLSTDEYPFKRPIYILNYQPNMGLGIGFSAFVTSDRGQRIVLKSGLFPATMPGREIIIRDKVN